MAAVEIRNLGSVYQGLDLKDVIPLFDGQRFHWNLLFIDVIGDLGEGKMMLDFDQEVNNSSEGLRMTWEQLTELSQKLESIIDIAFIRRSTGRTT